MTKYPWQNMTPKDFIQIEASKPMSLNDVHVLTKLYQPIIGGSAYALYQTLAGELNFQPQIKNITVSELLRKLDIGIPELYKARIRLEGIGLLRIYHSKTEESAYFYEVLPPLTAENFFKDSLLRTLLIEKIGERLFKEELNELLTSPNEKENYEETTRSFLDVYHFDVTQSNVLSEMDFMPIESEPRPKVADTIENVDTFDFDFFKKGLSRNFIRQDSLDAEIKELLYTFHVVYGIDELTMQELVLESADLETGKINKNKFTHHVQRSYFNQQKAQGIKSETTLENELAGSEKEVVKDPENNDLVKAGFSEGEITLIEHAKQTAPAVYLRLIKEQKNGFVTSNETWILKELVEQSPLNKEVVNILLHYILVIKEKVILDKNYAMAIANDWAQNDVRSVEDAIKKVKEMYKSSSQPKQNKRSYRNNYQRPHKKETLPDWATAEKTSDTKGNDDEQISAEEEDDLKIRLDQIRRLREQKEDN